MDEHEQMLSYKDTCTSTCKTQSDNLDIYTTIKRRRDEKREKKIGAKKRSRQKGARGTA